MFLLLEKSRYVKILENNIFNEIIHLKIIVNWPILRKGIHFYLYLIIWLWSSQIWYRKEKITAKNILFFPTLGQSADVFYTGQHCAFRLCINDLMNNSRCKPGSAWFGWSRHSEGFKVGVLQGDDLGHVVGGFPTLLTIWVHIFYVYRWVNTQSGTICNRNVDKSHSSKNKRKLMEINLNGNWAAEKTIYIIKCLINPVKTWSSLFFSIRLLKYSEGYKK